MKVPLLAASLACAGGLVSMPVAADAVTDDLHCYMIFGQLAASQDAPRQTAGTPGRAILPRSAGWSRPQHGLGSRYPRGDSKLTLDVIAAETAVAASS